MDIHTLIAEARAGRFGPVHVLVGAEHFLAERAAGLLRNAVVGEGPKGFNEDVFHGKSLSARPVLSAARTIPMMAPTRFVLVRDLDHMAAAELDGLSTYLDDPPPSTCLVAVATKLDGRSRFAKAAKKAGVWIDVEPVRGGALRQFAMAEARGRGHRLAEDAADALVDAVGSDLGALDDAVERLSLYAGEGRPIGIQAVEAVVTRVRVDTIWALVDAVSARDARRALGAAGSLLADREPPLRILAMIARQLRMVARMREALASGMRPPDAAKAAGAPPFKARELTEAARRYRLPDLASAFDVLAEADRSLKGSKVPPAIVMEQAVLRLCHP